MSIVIPKISELSNLATEQIKDILSNNGVALKVDQCNWPDEFPYTPAVSVKLCADSNALYALFSVKENNIRVATLENNGPVWEDSCVEIFIMNPDGKHYTNIEMNAAGTYLAAIRTGREDPEHFSPVELSKIKVISSLPPEVCDLKDSNGLDWSLIAIIPFTSVGFDEAPDSLKMNIYKCGDKTETPHFLSFAPICTAQPDFHRPEYFTDFVIE